MTRIIASMFLLLLVSACDWTPEEILVQDQATYQALSLAVGDTTTIQIAGQNIRQINSIDASIVGLTLTSNADTSHFQVVALSAGQTDLQLSYLAYDAEGEKISRDHYVHILVSDGIRLDVASRQETLISYADYLAEDEMLQLDSVSVSIESETGDHIILGDDIQDLNALSFMGNVPGEATILINFYNGEGGLINALLFECEVAISKMVMAELFTNSGCVNCPEANHYMDNIYADHTDNLALVRYHVSWTDPHDPMNNYNPTEVRERVIYYGIFFAPSFALDGNLVSTLDETDWISRIDAASQEPTPIHISPIDVAESLDSLFLSFDLESFQEDLGELDVLAMVLEDSVYYPGSNGEEIHMQVMRDLATTRVSGVFRDEEVSLSLKQPAGENQGTSRHLIVYLQDIDTRQIIQANKQILD